MLFILKALKYQVSLLIFKFLYSVIGTHVVEFANFLRHYELVSGVFVVCVLWMEHVRAEVQDGTLVDVEVLIVWTFVLPGRAGDVHRHDLAVILHKPRYLLAEAAGSSFYVLSERI